MAKGEVGEERGPGKAISDECQCKGSYTMMIHGTYREKGGFVWIIASLAVTYHWLCEGVGSVNLGCFCQYVVE